tara:strand:+ start:15303 stop:15437 length:135 start_codon:yes stop_codon:yes gene_type:complete
MKEKKKIQEEVTPQDMQKIRIVIRKELARIFFDLYRKRTTWEKS